MNYGLNLELEKQHQSEEDWIFGSASAKCIALIPEAERESYLPQGEVQRGAEDTMDCASRSVNNILAAKLTYLYRAGGMTEENARWLLSKGYFVIDRIDFSDAFVAINSGTTRQGNSLKAPLDAARKQGLIPKSMLPLESWMTWEDYHNPSRITDEMKQLGKEFAERFTVNYERVYEADFPTILENDLIDVGGFAWPTPVNGEYPRTGNTPNHSFVIFARPKYQCFDNYEEAKGDYIKKLAPNYDFMEYGYRVYISREVTIAQRISYWQQFLDILSNFFAIKKAVEKKIEDNKVNKTMENKKPAEVSPSDLIYFAAKEMLGQDASPKDLVKDGVGCAESVSTILSKLMHFPIITGTWTLFDMLRTRKDFEQVDYCQRGDIVLCVTGMGNGTIPGHAGIFGENNVIMSNDSKTGIWSENYTLDSWRERYVIGGGFKIYLFRKKVVIP